MLIGRGLAALERAQALGGAHGPYALQAAIAACHVRATRAEATDWPRIATLYALLAQRAPSPVVGLNRAVPVAMATGPGAGLVLVDAPGEAGELQHHLLPAVRGDLPARLGRHADAREEFERVAALARNARERAVLRARAAEAARSAT